MATAGLVTGAERASASSPSFHDECRYLGSGEYEDIVYDQDGHYSGPALWETDGDKTQAVDPRTDGYTVTAVFALGGAQFRRAATKGHGAYSPWATGNLPENHKYTMGDMDKGATGQSPGACTVKS